ncbi:ABC transporter permease [Intestinirhabdus alba]|jgi:molybdate transport system permease protein|uniref:ABC transporter permease subunit n=1 Tax=Intestinirhabdus alba TaxID=2899544 RepID=A0A6L6IE77_9ENTR|nr:ABC transporter permease [Intestinirhabdus alba]MTH45142.1 ABC transporter permease subunit [Intestinirhabdus alba]
MSKLIFLPPCLLLALVLGSLLSLLFELDLATLIQVLGDPELHFAVLLSLGTALLSLTLSLPIGISAGWVMARMSFRGKGVINTLLDIPLVTPPLIVGIGLLLLLGQRGPLASVLPGLSGLLFSPFGVVIAQTYVASAIILRSASAAFSGIDKAYINTAWNLGLTPLRTLFLVEIPLCRHALLGGCVLALARALGEFGATLMLAGAIRLKTETLPVAVYLNIASGDFSLAIGCALLLIMLAGSLLLALHQLQRLDKETPHAAH